MHLAILLMTAWLAGLVEFACLCHTAPFAPER